MQINPVAYVSCIQATRGEDVRSLLVVTGMLLGELRLQICGIDFEASLLIAHAR